MVVLECIGYGGRIVGHAQVKSVVGLYGYLSASVEEGYLLANVDDG